MKESKKATDEALKKPNPKTKAGKAATKKDLDNLVKENNKRKKPATKAATKEDLDAILDNKPKSTKAAAKAKKEVKDIRTDKQVNNEVAYDVGKKIGGARKDTARLKEAVSKLIDKNSGQSLEELEAISPEAAQKYCVKKNILPPMDNEYFEQEYKAGTDINVALAKAAIYDRIAPKPAGDTPKDRADYLNAVRGLQRILEPIKTWDEFKKATYSLGDRMKLELPKEISSYNDQLDYAKRKLNEKPSEYDLRAWNSKTKAYEDITEAQYKAKKQARVDELIKRGKDIEQAKKKPFAPLGEKCLNFFTNYESRQRTFDTIAKKKFTWDKYINEKMKAGKEEKKLPKGEKNKIKWERQMPAKIQRVGGRVSKVDKPEDMIKKFNFSGVEFGNWVDDSSGNFHMKKCAEAFMDLADIVGLSDKDVSFNGKLSMAFGARGKGWALAHYEPDSKAINITKEGGAGSLAHEWGHALDNMMYQQSAGHSSLCLASAGMGDQGDPAIKAAYKELMHEIKDGDGTGKDMVPNKNKTYYRYHPSFKKAVETLGLDGAIKKGVELINKEYDSKRDYYNTSVRNHYGDDKAEEYIRKAELKRVRSLNDMVQEMAYHHEKLTGEHLDEIPSYSGRSQYYVDSSKQGAKGNKYWTSSEEMFARAFENYIEGKMKSGRIKNDYLVHGTYDNIPGTTAPYPQGAERERIHAKFDKLMEAIKKSGAIQKALAIEDLSSSQRNRNAYNVVDTSEVIFIPVNRLKGTYQTEAALNFDKVKENVERMKNGENLEPVIIGYNYDVHDGHHRIEASKIMNYTHIPCVVGGSNDIDVQRAREAYREVWKSLKDDVRDIDLDGEKKAILDYSERIKAIKDPKVRKVIAEILADEQNHKHNLKQVLAYLNGDKRALDEDKLQG
jgi:hypothetical protein